VSVVEHPSESLIATNAADTQAAGLAFAKRLTPGDLVILSGELGAGKTTFTQGLAEGLGVRGPVTSPTFVLARVHPSLVGGPALVHVDAYRLGSLAELDDLDLDASMDESVTVVEWGEGKAEVLAEGRSGYYVVRLDRTREDDAREITVTRI
jgi:tRNA threonylcarbamoyladenosine biosynthesis protein TsaE